MPIKYFVYNLFLTKIFTVHVYIDKSEVMSSAKIIINSDHVALKNKKMQYHRDKSLFITISTNAY